MSIYYEEDYNNPHYRVIDCDQCYTASMDTIYCSVDGHILCDTCFFFYIIKQGYFVPHLNKEKTNFFQSEEEFQLALQKRDLDTMECMDQDSEEEWNWIRELCRINEEVE